MRSWVHAVCLGGLVAAVPSAGYAANSELCGVRGESFDPTGRLMDWS